MPNRYQQIRKEIMGLRAPIRRAYPRMRKRTFGGPGSRFAPKLQQVGRGEGSFQPSVKGMMHESHRAQRRRREARTSGPY